MTNWQSHDSNNDDWWHFLITVTSHRYDLYAHNIMYVIASQEQQENANLNCTLVYTYSDLERIIIYLQQRPRHSSCSLPCLTWRWGHNLRVRLDSPTLTVVFLLVRKLKLFRLQITATTQSWRRHLSRIRDCWKVRQSSIQHGSTPYQCAARVASCARGFLLFDHHPTDTVCAHLDQPINPSHHIHCIRLFPPAHDENDNCSSLPSLSRFSNTLSISTITLCIQSLCLREIHEHKTTRQHFYSSRRRKKFLFLEASFWRAYKILVWRALLSG